MQTNNMQRILMASFAMVLVLLAMPLVLAEDNESNGTIINDTEINDTDDSNQTVDFNDTESNETEEFNQTLDNETINDINDDLNESVSSWKIGWNRFKIWFTFNQEEKAKKELDLARLYALKARIALKNGNLKAMEKALDAHNKNLERVRERINAMDGSSTESGTRQSAEKLVGLARAIEIHELRIEKLRNLLENDLNLTEEQIARIEEQINKAGNNTAHLREVQEAKKEKLKTKLMAIGNMSEEEVENEFDEFDDMQNLSAIQKLIAEKRISELQDKLEEFKEKVAEAKAEGTDVTALESKISELEENIEEANVLIAEGKYEEALSKLRQFEGFKYRIAKEIKVQNKRQAKNNRERVGNGENFSDEED